MALSSEREEFTVRCHCSRVQAKFWANPQRLVAWDCDCSDCAMRQNVHLVVPKADFCLDMAEPLEEATTLYLWGTQTAKRYFCKTCGTYKLGTLGNLRIDDKPGQLDTHRCATGIEFYFPISSIAFHYFSLGILPWYAPRSNPDGYGITIHCVDWTKGGTLTPPPPMTIHKFDGVHWEDTIQQMKQGNAAASILDESKRT
jgi:hypothetical protein